ncbi:hypothetical protein C1280_00720 [Gemmata obscuriglobus]|uniref:Uncharacterized protein n=1 Tax=Gemmata obscuriglobus TaxID=114 RepID=A0A2Z3GQX1_9BACT|nr:hypothetical protein C1280_00720 [Gemmata obscuriglobus]
MLLLDAIRVTSTIFLRGEIEAMLPLAGLQPRVDWLRLRSSTFWSGLMGATLAGCGWPVLVEGLKLDPLGLGAVLVGGVGLVCASVALATVRKTEFAQLVTDAGVPALLIARARRGVGDFDEFVEQVHQQIRVCKGLN